MLLKVRHRVEFELRELTTVRAGGVKDPGDDGCRGLVQTGKVTWERAVACKVAVGFFL